MDILTLLVIAGAIGMIVLIWAGLNPRPTIEISDRGLLDRSRPWRRNLGRILWSEIQGAYPPNAHDQDALFLKVRVSDRLSRRVRRQLGSRAGDPLPETIEVRLDLAEAEISPTELLQEILRRSGSDVAPDLGDGLPNDA